MASYFRKSRNIELSLLYYLTTCLAADWSGTIVVKTFKEVYTSSITLPVVCVRLASSMATRLEIGATTLKSYYLVIIDIFATSDAMRLDMADYIMDKLKDGWTHYDHSHAVGDKTTLVRIANGRDYIVDFINDAKIDIGEQADEKDKFRHSISIRVWQD